MTHFPTVLFIIFSAVSLLSCSTDATEETLRSSSTSDRSSSDAQSESAQENGSISFRLNSNELNSEASFVNVTLTPTDGDSIEHVSDFAADAVVKIESLLVGEYNIKISLQDSTGLDLEKGDATVMVKAGETTPVSIKLIKIENYGEIEISIESADQSDPQIKTTPLNVDIPEFARWQTQMTEVGTKRGDELIAAVESKGEALSGTYYDMMRVYYNIADYTGDSSYLKYVEAAKVEYRDKYVIPNNGSLPGYWNFTKGLRMHYERTGDDLSRQAVVMLSENAAYARDGTNLDWTKNSAKSREVSYAIMSYIDAELVGEPRRARLNDLFLQALDHVDGMFVRNEEANWAPFMFGLTAEALMYYYKHIEQDPRILEKLKLGADQIWARAWRSKDESFFYRAESPDNGAPDLNLLIVPVFGWLYLETGDAKYADQGDQIFAGGVKGAWLGGNKQFNQNYRGSIDYVKMRAAAE